MMNIDHIGIAVADLDSAIELYSKLLKRTTCRREVVESQQTEVAFFQAGESAIELLSSTAEDSPVGKFLKKRGEGVHHIAFQTDDIESEIKRLKNEGLTPLSDQPVQGANGKRVMFFHPRDLTGVLVELCGAVPERWPPSANTKGQECRGCWMICTGQSKAISIISDLNTSFGVPNAYVRPFFIICTSSAYCAARFRS